MLLYYYYILLCLFLWENITKWVIILGMNYWLLDIFVSYTTLWFIIYIYIYGGFVLLKHIVD